jgi:hypothetical protein
VPGWQRSLFSKKSGSRVWREPVARRRLANGDRHTHTAGEPQVSLVSPGRSASRPRSDPLAGSTQAKADRDLIAPDELGTVVSFGTRAAPPPAPCRCTLGL